MYELVGHLGNFCQFGAANLATLEVRSNLPGLPGGSGWLRAAPRAKRLVVTCDEDDMDWEEMPTFLSGEEFDELDSVELIEWVAAGKPHLLNEHPLWRAAKSMYRSGPHMRDRRFPAMPHLRSLSLWAPVRSGRV